MNVFERFLSDKARNQVGGNDEGMLQASVTTAAPPPHAAPATSNRRMVSSTGEPLTNLVCNAAAIDLF